MSSEWMWCRCGNIFSNAILWRRRRYHHCRGRLMPRAIQTVFIYKNDGRKRINCILDFSLSLFANERKNSFIINSIQIHFSDTIGNGYKITKLAENSDWKKTRRNRKKWMRGGGREKPGGHRYFIQFRTITIIIIVFTFFSPPALSCCLVAARCVSEWTTIITCVCVCACVYFTSENTTSNWFGKHRHDYTMSLLWSQRTTFSLIDWPNFN